MNFEDKKKHIIANAKIAQESKRYLLDRWDREILHKEKIPCKKCTHDYCCYQTPIAFAFEGILIANRIQNDIELRNRVIDCAKNQKQLMTEGREKAAWTLGGAGCLFLKDGRCSIYDIRPMACSSYFVVSEPEQCRGPETKRVIIISNHQVMHITCDMDAEFCKNTFGSISLAGPSTLYLSVFNGVNLMAPDMQKADFVNIS